MTEILNFLRAYPDDPAAVMSKTRVAEAIAEIERLRAELAAERERAEYAEKTMYEFQAAADDAEDERDALRAELAAANERMSKLDFERTAAELERDAFFAELSALRVRRPIIYSPDAQAMSDRVKAAEAERDALRALLREARNIMPRDWAFWSRIDAALKGDGDE